MVAHCAAGQVESVAAQLLRATESGGRGAMGARSGGRASIGGGEAAEVALAASAITAALGGETMAKGLQGLRARGGRVPSHMVRDARNIDAAAALLRHPGAAARIGGDIVAWIRKMDGLESSTDASDADGPHGESGTIAGATAEVKMVEPTLPQAENVEKAQSKSEDAFIAKYGLTDYCFTIRNTVQEEKLKDQFENGDKEKIEEAVQNTLCWLGAARVTDAMSYKGKRKELEDIVNPLLLKVFGHGFREDHFEAKCCLANYCYTVRNVLQEEKMQDKFEDSVKCSVEDAVQKALDWLDRPQITAVAGFEGKHKELESIVNPMLLDAFGSERSEADLLAKYGLANYCFTMCNTSQAEQQQNRNDTVAWLESELAAERKGSTQLNATVGMLESQLVTARADIAQLSQQVMDQTTRREEAERALLFLGNATGLVARDYLSAAGEPPNR